MTKDTGHIKMSLIKNLKTINKIAISNYFHRETQKGGHIQNAEQLFVQPRHIPTCNRDFKKRTITRIVGLIAFGRPDNSVIGPKVYASEFKATYQNFGTVTTPAAETKSIGLPAIARAVMVFASPSGQFYRDVTTPFHLPGFSHLDNFIVTPKSCPLTGTLQKRMPTLTQTATPHTTGPLCVIT